MKKVCITLMVLTTIVLGATNGSIYNIVSASSDTSEKNEIPSVKNNLGQIPYNTLKAIKNKDFKKLSEMINPQKGLMIATSPFLNEENYIIFTTKSFLEYSIGKKRDNKVKWGVYEGTGNTISLTFNNFYKDFLWNTDYLGKNIKVTYTNILQRSNTTSTYNKKFPSPMKVEFYYPGTKKNGNLNWKSEILIYDKIKGKIYLSAIILDSWRI